MNSQQIDDLIRSIEEYFSLFIDSKANVEILNEGPQNEIPLEIELSSGKIIHITIKF